MVQPLWKAAWLFLIKLNIFLTHNPTIALLGIYPKGFESLYSHKNLHVDVYSNFIHNYPNLEEPSCLL